MKRTLFSCLTALFISVLFVSGSAYAATTGTVTYDFAIKGAETGSSTRLWTPYPMSDKDQDISNVVITGNFEHSGIYRDAKSGAVYLYADWSKSPAVPTLSMSFHVNSHFSKGGALKSAGNDIPADIQPYLATSIDIPCDNADIKKLAAEAVGDKKDILSKARAVYDWTIKNTFRDPDVKGCGLGKPLATLTEAKGGGKCADISSVFVAVARAAGVPARDVFGLRSSGKSGEITGDFHCWAEFYLPGKGWVTADPADVRKAMLVEKLDINDAAAKEKTDFFWNGDALFRIVLSRADRGITFTPAQQDGPLSYFMYPYAEVNGKALDYRDPKSFGYKVMFQAD